MERKIYHEKIPSTDPRLKRQIYHDSKSREFAFNTAGLEIVDVEHKRLIPVLDQGQIGSCTGNAGIGDINTEPFKQGPNPFYSPDEIGALRLYSDAEKIDGGAGYPPEDNGSYGLSIAKALKNAGMISPSYQHTFSLNDALKALSKYPLITGTDWYEGMYHPDPDGRVHPSGPRVGGHEYQAFKVDVKNGRIWFYNSWGKDWGLNGTFYMTWLDYALLLSRKGDVTVLFPKEITPPAPVIMGVMPVLRLGSKGDYVKLLQNKLNQNGSSLVVDGSFGLLTKNAVISFQSKHRLSADGIVGKMTWQAFDMIDIITKICIEESVEPLLGISVASCESSLNPKATLYNPPSKSTDRGLFQWNDVYHKEISDAEAFDPAEATKLFCHAAKNGLLHTFWSASQPCWIKKLTPELITKYHLG